MIITATREHINWIIRHRVEMFRSMGWTDENLAITERVTREFLEQKWIDNPEILLAVEDGKIAGGVAINYSTILPSNRNPTGKNAYIMNVYVEEKYRNRGIATDLMNEALNECRKNFVGRVSLHATDMSERIYTKLGFEKSENYLQMYLN